MSNKTIVSCRNCLDRYPGCHQYCKTYKKERAEYERKKVEERNSKNVDYYNAERIGRLRDRSTKDKKTHHNFGWWNFD